MRFRAILSNGLTAVAGAIWNTNIYCFWFKSRCKSTSQELKNQLGTALSELSSFLPDNKATKINQFCNKSVEEKFELRDAEESMDLNEFRIKSGQSGLSIRIDFADFVSQVEKFDLSDPIYYQRAYTLAGLEYTLPHRRKFWQLFLVVA